MPNVLSILGCHRDELCACECVSALHCSNAMPAERRFADALAVHLHAKERHVFPVLRAVGWSGVTFDMLVEHVVVKRGLADYLGAQTDAARDTAMTALYRSLGATYTVHLRALQGVVDAHLSDDEQALLADELTAALDQIRPYHPGDSEGPEALLQEARLVLSSLSGAALNGRGPSAAMQASVSG